MFEFTNYEKMRTTDGKKELCIVLHNIRSAHNVGSIFRTADGLGATKIYLTGYTPAPFDEKKEVYPTVAQKMIAKTALGAEKIVAWEEMEDIFGLISKFKKEKVQVLALELHSKSISIDKIKKKFPAALILGNEIKGIEEKILKAGDEIVAIPMIGRKESFNVSVAGAIAMYEILK